MTEPKAYHIHVYFNDATVHIARRLYEHLEATGNDTLGRFHDTPVGPHPSRQFNYTVKSDDLEKTCRWLDEVRDGLDVLIHPLIDNDYLAHTDMARWLGNAHPLNLEKLS